MRILVTGAHGFIGSHLTEHLLAAGHQVRALVSPWGRLDNLAAVSGHSALELLRADVVDAASLRGACVGVDAVAHAAARVADWGCESDFERINVGGTANLLEEADRSGTSRFVLVSSVAVHRYSGFRDADPEAVPRDGNGTAYDRSKREAEDLVFSWRGTGVVVRPGLWPFGPRDRNLQRVARALKRGALPLVGDGRAVLNTAFVGNLVAGIERAAVVDGVRGRAFVIADEGRPTWREVLGHLARLLGAPKPWLQLPPRLAVSTARIVEGAWSRVAPRHEPPLTRYRAGLMVRDVHFSIARTQSMLGYRPACEWREGLELSLARDRVLRALLEDAK